MCSLSERPKFRQIRRILCTFQATTERLGLVYRKRWLPQRRIKYRPLCAVNKSLVVHYVKLNAYFKLFVSETSTVS